jgi:phosphoglycerate-specific signal transduction histidine kinase
MPPALAAALEVPGRATEMFCRHHNGSWREFECVARTIRDEQGSPQNAVVVLRDVTDRRRAEADLREAQLQLIQAEKMESVGRLAAGVAHEVKNPLTAIFMGVEYLRQCFGEKVEPDVVTLLQDMEESARKANRVVRGLLDFSMPGKLDLRAENLNEVIDGALAMLKHEFLRGKIE